MAGNAQGLADHEMQPVADAMRDAAAAAASHAVKVKRTVRAIFSFLSNAAIAAVRWVRRRLRRR